MGAPALNYPASSSIAEPGGNEIMDQAPALTPVSPPAGAPLAGPLYKRVTVAGSVTTGDADDWFFVYVPAGKKLRATLTPGISDDDLYLWQASAITQSINSGALIDQVSWPAQSGGHAYYLRVHHYADLLVLPNGALPIAPYRLDVDFL